MGLVKVVLCAAVALLLVPSLAMAGTVTSNAIFGSGNSNEAWTVVQGGGIELALRAKLRHNDSGQPENTFNYDGVDTYWFLPGVAPTQSYPTAVWSFEWSINSDWSGTDGTSYDLDDLKYVLSMTGPGGVTIPSFDLIAPSTHPNGWWDHSIGDNSTGQGAGVEATDTTTYASLIAGNNLAQNSWKPSWFISGFNPNVAGDYQFTLAAYNGTNKLAQTDMTVTVVPLPAALWLGLTVIGTLGVAKRLRRRVQD